MVSLLGFAALGIDVAHTQADKQQLQNGADAAALAIAQDCAKGNCGNPASTASTLAGLNKAGSTGVVETSPLSPSTGHVTVRTTGQTNHWFAQVLGTAATTVNARASAAWEAPSGATSFPLTISYCELTKQPGVVVGSGGNVTVAPTSSFMTFYTTDPGNATSKANSNGCPLTGASGSIPGGFAHLSASSGPSGSCYTTSTTQGSTSIVPTSPGNTPDNDCSPAYYNSLLGKSVLVPVFNAVNGTGNNATYTVVGYAAFVLYSFNLGGQFKSYIAPETGLPCSGSDRCIRGQFVTYVFPDSVASVGGTAPNLGATVVRLSG